MTTHHDIKSCTCIECAAKRLLLEEPKIANARQLETANARQVGGNHYKKHVLQHWDLAAYYGWDYFQARTIAYLMRWRDKAGIQDLEKAKHTIEKYIEVEKARQSGTLTTCILSAALQNETAAAESPNPPAQSKAP